VSRFSGVPITGDEGVVLGRGGAGMVPTDLNVPLADDDAGVLREGAVMAPTEPDGRTDGDDSVVPRCGAGSPLTPLVDLEPFVVDVLGENWASARFTDEIRTSAARLMDL
jgi:hypothetical protein